MSLSIGINTDKNGNNHNFWQVKMQKQFNRNYGAFFERSDDKFKLGLDFYI